MHVREVHSPAPIRTDHPTLGFCPELTLAFKPKRLAADALQSYSVLDQDFKPRRETTFSYL